MPVRLMKLDYIRDLFEWMLTDEGAARTLAAR